MKIMEDKVREARRAYHREWRKRNPEKARAIQMRYWVRRAKKMEEAQSKKNLGAFEQKGGAPDES